MLESLKEKFRSAVDPLIEQLETELPELEAAAAAARASHVDVLLQFHEGQSTEAALEKSRKTVQAADDDVTRLKSELRGAIERRDALAAMRQNKATAEAHAARVVKRDAALALADESDQLSREMGAAVEHFAAVRSRLIAKRSELAGLVQELGGIDDPKGAALHPLDFDAFLRIDMGALGLHAFGPAWTDPSKSRPLTLAERVTGGSAVVRSILMQRVPD